MDRNGSIATACPLPPERQPWLAKAVLLGERIDTRGLSAGAGLASTPVLVQAPEGGVAFVFRYGAVVLIGMEPAAEAAMLESLRERTTAREEFPATEEALLALENATDAPAPDGAVMLAEVSLENLQIVAHVLSRSVVLASQEAAIAMALDRIEPFVSQLRDSGGVLARDAALLKQVGHVLSALHRMTVRVEAEDKPDVLWDLPLLERLYARLIDDYEVVERSRALTRKLDLIKDSIGSLLQIVATRRATRLEWAIIWLIAFEIVLSLYGLFVGGRH